MTECTELQELEIPVCIAHQDIELPIAVPIKDRGLRRLPDLDGTSASCHFSSPLATSTLGERYDPTWTKAQSMSKTLIETWSGRGCLWKQKTSHPSLARRGPSAHFHEKSPWIPSVPRLEGGTCCFSS